MELVGINLSSYLPGGDFFKIDIYLNSFVSRLDILQTNASIIAGLMA